MKHALPILLPLSLLAAACQHAPPAPPEPEALRARDLYPLRIGNQWTYERRGAGVSEVRTISIVSENDSFFTDTGGGQFRQDARGFRDPQRYLIENPVRKNHSWFAVNSVHSTERFEISEVGKPCTVKAGTFGRCVTVRATNQVDEDRSIVIESTYAEGIGLVSLHTEQVRRNRTPQIVMELELVSYHLAP